MRGKTLLIVALAAPALFATVTARAQDNAVHGVAGVVLEAALPAAAPGQVLSLRRVTFAPKASIPGEVHPGMQVVSVVSGHLGLQVLGGVALVRRVQPDGSMGPQQEVHFPAVRPLLDVTAHVANHLAHRREIVV